MGRYQFLLDEYPNLYKYCSDADKYIKYIKEDVSIALLKARQALETIIEPFTIEDKNNLGYNIGYFAGFGIDRNQIMLFDKIREVSNKAIHRENVDFKLAEECIDDLYRLAIWYALFTYQRVYDLSEFEEKYRPSIKDKVQQENARLKKNMIKKGEIPADFYGVDIDPLEPCFSADEGVINTPNNKISQEATGLSELQHVEEQEDMAILESQQFIRIGKGILLPDHMDEHTGLGFLKFCVNRPEKDEIFSYVDAFYIKIYENAKKDMIQGEILAKKKYKGDKVFCDYGTVFLQEKNGTKIPLQTIGYRKFRYENETEFRRRISKLPEELPLGVCRIDKNIYNSDTSNLTICITPFQYIQSIDLEKTITFPIEETETSKWSSFDEVVNVYGKIEKNASQWRITQVSIFNPNFQIHWDIHTVHKLSYPTVKNIVSKYALWYTDKQLKKNSGLRSATETHDGALETYVHTIDSKKVPSFHKTDLKNIDLSNTVLAFVDFSQSDLSHANLENANLCGANLQGACLVDANLKGANLERVDLTKANLLRAHLEDATWKSVQYVPVDISGAFLGEHCELWGDTYRIEHKYSCIHNKISLEKKRVIIQVRKDSTAEQQEKVLNEWYRKQLKLEIPTILSECEKCTGMKVDSVLVRNMHDKWVSCNGKKKSISLNLQLIHKKKEILKAIIIYELLSLLEGSHTAKFTKSLHRYVSDWDSIQESLGHPM